MHLLILMLIERRGLLIWRDIIYRRVDSDWFFVLKNDVEKFSV